MADIPEEAVEAAAKALIAKFPMAFPMPGDVGAEADARVALHAAWPHLLAAAGKAVSEEDVRRIAQEAFDTQKGRLLDDVARQTDERLERTAHLVRVAERARIRQQLITEADRGAKSGLDRIALRAFADRLGDDDA